MALTRGGVSTDTNRATKPSKTPSKRPLPSTFSDEVIVVFVLGGPGSGKGSQCLKIMDRFGFKHLCAGELLQAEIDSGSENGAMIHNFKKAGKIVPSTVTVKLLQQAMSQSETRKFIIDGFPRNEENRIAFEQIDSFVFRNYHSKHDAQFFLLICKRESYGMTFQSFLVCSVLDFKNLVLEFLRVAADNLVETVSLHVVPCLLLLCMQEVVYAEMFVVDLVCSFHAVEGICYFVVNILSLQFSSLSLDHGCYSEL